MEHPGRFDGQAVLITGAGSGIGRATSCKLASLGASLALCDINSDALEGTLASCAPSAPRMAKAFDVGDATAVDAFVASAVTELGGIDHVFNCAGVNPTHVLVEATTEDYWFKLVNTNLKGTFNVTRATTPHLTRGSSYVNVASIAGIRPEGGTAVYSMTKAGIIGFSKSMANELGPRGIRTNIVAPGAIDTPTNSAVVAGPDRVKAAEEKIALGRIGSAEEVADVVIFLFSKNSSFMNGSVVEVNGGL